jgi:TorA maturation chaperone TorD
VTGHGSLSAAEVFRALGVMCEPPADGHARVAEALGLPAFPDAAEYTDLFVLHLYPYASVYLGADGMIGGEAGDRIAGFWRALHLSPPPEPDHVAALLGLYASIVEREAEERDEARRLLWRQARAALLHEHLASWLPPYLDRVENLAPPTYAGWARLLLVALREETGGVGPSQLVPSHLRAVPPLPDPRREGSSAFVSGLLAPVRCGIILTRADFARAARDLGLGLRIGERKFALAALFSQASDEMLAWLAAEADTRSSCHLAHEQVMGAAAAVWAERATRAAHLLRDLRTSALEVGAG